ncbi:N-acetylneuraminate synthase [Lentibacillus saliphilus]|uniref:N-acetylneuraminate synthase n=1 Tax=Lentibacillus saliphilus TaxID=2737028 RepID=UPI001C30D32E|nr:N-acetylneuraminate synthase [Lentibacillus saliphilus]
MTKTFIIAEAGVNHNGSLDLAFKLVDAAVNAQADAIKFQTFKTENLVTKSAEQADYQKKNIGKVSSQYDMLKKLELSYREFIELKQYCDKKGIMFLSTPFDLESVDFLVHDLNLSLMKIASGEITNAPYLYQIANLGVDVILSTGMATVEEIHNALAFLAYGYQKKENITFKNARQYYKTKEAKDVLKGKVSILHCTSEYPTPYEEINLNTIEYIKEKFDLPTGLSDHSQGIIAPVAAVAKGACIIEKHFTLDKKMDGPDHKASLDPLELKEMVESIRITEKALGDWEKKPIEIELKNREVARKSLVASCRIKRGETFSSNNLTVKRPGTGVAPYYYWDCIGKTATRNYEKDEMI